MFYNINLYVFPFMYYIQLIHVYDSNNAYGCFKRNGIRITQTRSDVTTHPNVEDTAEQRI